MMKEEEKLYTKELYDLSHTAAAPLLEGTTYPWEALPQIGAFIRELGAGLSLEKYDHPQEDVWIHKTAKVYPNNFIAGPCVIGAGGVEQVVELPLTKEEAATFHACCEGIRANMAHLNDL